MKYRRRFGRPNSSFSAPRSVSFNYRFTVYRIVRDTFIFLTRNELFREREKKKPSPFPTGKTRFSRQELATRRLEVTCCPVRYKYTTPPPPSPDTVIKIRRPLAEPTIFGKHFFATSGAAYKFCTRTVRDFRKQRV